jgi:hypothetical protein
MNGPVVELSVFLLAFALPGTLIGWTLGILSAGQLRDRPDQPASFRFIAVRFPTRVPGAVPDEAGFAVAVALLGLANFYPAGALLLWPYGPLGRAILGVYFLTQGLWLLRVRRAIVRASARDETSSRGE